MYYSDLFADCLAQILSSVAVVTIMVLWARSMWGRRFFSRFAVDLRAQCRLDGDYHEFRRLDVFCNGKCRHIDYVYVSRYGIFVVNTPNQQGRISGRADGQTWLQKLYKRETAFPNPLLENQRYILALSEKLGLPRSFFFSVAVFANSRFHTMLPDNVVDAADFAEYIAQYDEPLLTDLEVEQVKLSLDTNEFDVVFDRRNLSSAIR